MAKRNPFDYVKSINKKTYEYDLSGYNPFLTNRAFAGFIDTIMLAHEMNQHPDLSPYLQYQFYYYGVRKGSRFDPITKPSEPAGLEVVMAYYQYSKQKALEVMSLLSKQDIQGMLQSMDKGGNK
jgi:hypothetical protein